MDTPQTMTEHTNHPISPATLERIRRFRLIDDLDAVFHMEDFGLEDVLEARERGGTGQKADERRDDVSDKAGHDFAERAADDNADGHVENVALEREFLKILEKLFHKETPFS